MSTATKAPRTGIRNADELINLAAAFGLTVTVEEKDRETLTSYVVRFAIPVPVAYAGTELGRTIAGDTMTLLWTKAKKKGARGCLVDATVWSVADHRKVRTLREVTAAVETLGHSSVKYARDAAPLPDDVVDASHALYIDGELRKEGIPADRVRTFVKNRRFRGLLTHQDDDGAIICDNRRYAPVRPEETAGQPAEDRAPVARPAAEVLAADPIPADVSVLEGMPGQVIASDGKFLSGAREGMAHDDYVAQLRNGGAWILPNHDDQADITRSGIVHAVSRILASAPTRARASIDTDGTVYLSNGYQAARYIPAALIAGYSAEVCPGCNTAYATNGDGPCASMARLELAGR
ncbi:hypothetical protein [Streptomyces sp. CL12-4]|uniref:hypothetical protein n=1 Tax=Streptomyces sp. CL12-4 TaxID=2810306 RepID=UPI001EFBACCC|nr:hypothetical protein [Streptomyces sp. CL12-4]MCG8971833.1 hypothetical protein [Streptomyces sp. CL12-4]